LEFQPLNLTDPLDETARSALAKSCYLKINWKISENEKVVDAINRMVAHDIGALAVFDDKAEVCGVISERDIIKIAHLDKSSRETKISEICTYGKANLVSVTLDNPIDNCMRKMLDNNVRHLLVRERDTGSMVGMISVKDIVKCATAKQDAMIGKLTEMVVTNTAMLKDT
jgi:signal-transduction protein with cAMP-binding, CBS, and nucleotidyltransferase domain